MKKTRKRSWKRSWKRKLLIILLAAAVVIISLKGHDFIEQHLAHFLTPEEAVSSTVIPSVKDAGEWKGSPAIVINGNVPFFTDEEIRTEFYQEFSPLDELGRCGPATACVERKNMPLGERGEIGMVRPSGWQIEKYDFIDNGGFLFNRCHLIGWQLTGENEEERNLITGTRYLNTEGMLPYENKVAQFVRDTGKHVMYRVTPVFNGDELVARGVQIEALSVEDNGRGLSLNVYCYNVQPGVEIDYNTGKSRLVSENQTR